jgi:hypothetical protein
MSELLPIGTRIVFTKSLFAPPCEDHPSLIYARKGDGGCVTGHGCKEGHWVKWDKWDAPFGAELGTEFAVAANQQATNDSGSQG